MTTNGTKEKPILFSGPMVRAILEGRKTQTRRVMKPQPDPSWMKGTDWSKYWFRFNGKPVKGLWIPYPNDIHKEITCPYGAPDDRLWVRETHLVVGGSTSSNPRVVYRASNDGPDEWVSPVWRPSIFMPRWASRLTLGITDIRVERLQALSRIDAQAEGMLCSCCKGYHSRRCVCIDLYWEGWDKLNAKRGYSWESNPWVWVISFQRTSATGDNNSAEELSGVFKAEFGS